LSNYPGPYFYLFYGHILFHGTFSQYIKNIVGQNNSDLHTTFWRSPFKNALAWCRNS